MLTRTDIREIGLTLNINGCSIQNMVGAYVNADKDIVCRINQRFLTLPEELLFKYLAIAKKMFNKNVDDNTLAVPFEDTCKSDESKRLLQILVESKLKDEDALEMLYDRIIEEYYCESNFLILLWYDVYDIPGKGTDGKDQDESEEIYAHIMCAICRVDLTTAGLSYKPKDNTFAVRERDWVVDMPSCGFVYPAFENREVEWDKAMFYTAKPAEAPHDFMERGLGLKEIRTITEIRKDFSNVLKQALGSVYDAEYWMPHIGKQIYLTYGDDEEAILPPDELEILCNQTGMGEVNAQNIRKAYRGMFYLKYPKAAYFLNKSMIKDVEALIKKQELQNTCRKAAVALEQAVGENELTEELRTLADGK